MPKYDKDKDAVEMVAGFCLAALAKETLEELRKKKGELLEQLQAVEAQIEQTRRGLDKTSHYSFEEVTKTAEAVVTDNPTQAEEYRAGNYKLRGFFVGQVFKRLKGKTDPKTVNRCVTTALMSQDNDTEEL